MCKVSWLRIISVSIEGLGGGYNGTYQCRAMKILAVLL